MFARIKKSGKYQYLQIVENRKEKGKVKQRVIATIGRLDRMQAKGRVENIDPFPVPVLRADHDDPDREK